jgi:hypothetical protein
MQNQSKTGICAYIDILGFSNHIKSDPQTALHLLQNYQAVLGTGSYQAARDESLMPYCQESFKYFIPFSDSIFLYSEKPCDFVQQLSHFVHSSFSFTSNQYKTPEDPKYPHKVTVRAFEIEDGKPITKEYEEDWPPLLFRGGIGLGNATVIELNAIHNGLGVKTPAVFGKSVVDAVKLEQSGVKGPRILCDQNLYDQLDDRTKRIVHPASDVKGCYDINWTAIDYLAYEEQIFNPEDIASVEWFIDQLLTNHFYLEMLVPATNLWKAYNHLNIAPHYFGFLRLIVQGVLHFFESSDYYDQVRSKVAAHIEKLGIADKADDLMLIIL